MHEDKITSFKHIQLSKNNSYPNLYVKCIVFYLTDEGSHSTVVEVFSISTFLLTTIFFAVVNYSIYLLFSTGRF